MDLGKTVVLLKTEAHIFAGYPIFFSGVELGFSHDPRLQGAKNREAARSC